MKLTLIRIAFRETYTIGRLFVNGEYFCDTLEDVPREIKIPDQTCIPTGTYKVILNLSNRFKKIMPLLVDVPGFSGIRIHSGNTDKDTSGCILVGYNKIIGQLVDSKKVFTNLMLKLLKEDNIFIEIK